VWSSECQTCKQHFTGAMQVGLAEAWWSRLCNQAEENGERLRAAGNLGHYRHAQGRYQEVERIHSELLGVLTRVLGEEHLSTVTTASNLATSLSVQGKHVQAGLILREVLGVLKRRLGEEHPSTLTSARCLACRGGCSARSIRKRWSLRQVWQHPL